MTENELTHAEKIQGQTLGNLQASIAISLGYLKEKGEELQDFARYSANIAREFWPNAMTVSQFCDSAAVNWESFGCKIIEKKEDENESILIYADYMPDRFKSAFNLTTDDVDQMNHFFAHMAEKYNLQYTWKRDGENTKVTIKKI